jgi:predicted nuclease of predicted toxin-antitoxin system
MRVFVDACIDPRAARVFADHEVQTEFDLGWQHLQDHVLLPMVAAGFDVFVTADKGFEYEHNLRNLPIGIVIVHPKNKVEFTGAKALASARVSMITPAFDAQ